MADGAVALSVLVVDDNRSAADSIARLLAREGHTVHACYDGQTAIDKLAMLPYHLVLTDLRMEPVDGMAVVAAARAADPPVEVIVFTAFGTVEAAVEAMRLGAMDFLTKPVTADQLLRRVRELQVAADPNVELVGDSAHAGALRDQAAQLASVRSTVLLTGETGSGRTHLARWLHQRGLDRERPLVIARPGHSTDARALADAGTFLVPSVDDWTLEAQTTLLRTLETLEAGRPPRVIATASPAVDIRVARGELLPELYFRLAVLVLRLAPLRERPDDVEPLLLHFIQQHSAAFSKSCPSPTPDQLATLATHGWPGNVREVANLAERAVVLGPSAFQMTVKPFAGSGQDVPTLAEGFNLPEHLEEIERVLLIRAMEQTSGDRPAMGRLLGLERNTLRYKLNKYSLLERG